MTSAQISAASFPFAVALYFILKKLLHDPNPKEPTKEEKEQIEVSKARKMEVIKSAALTIFLILLFVFSIAIIRVNFFNHR